MKYINAYIDHIKEIYNTPYKRGNSIYYYSWLEILIEAISQFFLSIFPRSIWVGLAIFSAIFPNVIIATSIFAAPIWLLSIPIALIAILPTCYKTPFSPVEIYWYKEILSVRKRPIF